MSAHHPWLEPVNPDRGERLSDADPAGQAIVTTADGRAWHVPPVGSIPHQLSRARSEGTASTRDIQAAHEAGRHGEYLLSNGASPRQDRLESYDQEW